MQKNKVQRKHGIFLDGEIETECAILFFTLRKFLL